MSTPSGLFSRINDRTKRNNPNFRNECLSDLALAKRFGLETTLAGHRGAVRCVNWSPSGDSLVSGSMDLKVRLWDLSTRKSQVFNAGLMQTIYCVKFFDRENIISSGECISLLNIPSSNYRLFGGHRGPINDIAIDSQSSHIFLSGGDDGTVRQYDLREGPRAGALYEGSIVVDLRHQRRRIYQTGVGVSVSMFITTQTKISNLCINPSDNNELAVTGADPFIRLYDRRMMGTERSVESVRKIVPSTVSNLRHASAMQISGIAYNHNGSKLIASYCGDNLYTLNTKDQLVPKPATASQPPAKKSKTKPSTDPIETPQKDSPSKKRKSGDESPRTSSKKRTVKDPRTPDRSPRSIEMEEENSPRVKKSRDGETNEQEPPRKRKKRDGSTSPTIANQTDIGTTPQSNIETHTEPPVPTATTANSNIPTLVQSTPNAAEMGDTIMMEIETDLGLGLDDEPEQDSPDVMSTISRLRSVLQSLGETAQQPTPRPIPTQMVGAFGRFLEAMFLNGIMGQTGTQANEQAGHIGQDQQTEQNIENQTEPVVPQQTPRDPRLLGGIGMMSFAGMFGEPANMHLGENVPTVGDGNLFPGIIGSLMEGLNELPTEDNNHRHQKCENEFLDCYSGHKNTSPYSAVTFLGPNSEYAVSGSDGGKIFIWDTRTGKIVTVLNADSQVAASLSAHPTTLMMASGGKDHTVKLWSPCAEKGVSDEDIATIEAENAIGPHIQGYEGPVLVNIMHLEPRQDGDLQSELRRLMGLRMARYHEEDSEQ